ncbi:hypothetical protein IWQ62_001381 [Dispira parvispora]|uniref:Kinesin motor domain-containing protein n=1 Tax=Dispira parvispora TaxID=1520584 RepID=A0A9W8AY39_9FUNG|nr:hypothetical protein IWQ62_001381 [Dispira parvispora]
MATTVRVALRVRPLMDKEAVEGDSTCITFVPNEPQVVVGLDKSFTFDHVFPPATVQAEVYDRCVTTLVHQFLDGYNATILAYGQTGSGKTYSMGTATPTENPHQNTEQLGVVPRAAQELFAALATRAVEDPEYEYRVQVSFLELYNEELVDLLQSSPKTQPATLGGASNGSHTTLSNSHGGQTAIASASHTGGTPANLTIREDAQGGIVWGGVVQRTVGSEDELLHALHAGSLSRTTAATDMNLVSSRSHAIFSVQLWQNYSVTEENKDGEAPTPIRRTLLSKFHFVDLAGSERIKRTNAVGDRVKEGISINSGLLALGNVISALGDESRKASHIPYRDSKLTRLLQDSLGGNSQTLMLACVSPSESNILETINTLKYANRARNIKNRVTINIDPFDHSTDINVLRMEIKRLRSELVRSRRQPGISSPLLRRTTDESPASLGPSPLSQPIRSIQRQLQACRKQVHQVTSELDSVKAQRDSLLISQQGEWERLASAPLTDPLFGSDAETQSAAERSPDVPVHPLLIPYRATIVALREKILVLENTPLLSDKVMEDHGLGALDPLDSDMDQWSSLEDDPSVVLSRGWQSRTSSRDNLKSASASQSPRIMAKGLVKGLSRVVSSESLSSALRTPSPSRSKLVRPLSNESKESKSTRGKSATDPPRKARRIPTPKSSATAIPSKPGAKTNKNKISIKDLRAQWKADGKNINESRPLPKMPVRNSAPSSEIEVKNLRSQLEALKLEKQRMLKRMKAEVERTKDVIHAQEMEIETLRRRSTSSSPRSSFGSPRHSRSPRSWNKYQDLFEYIFYQGDGDLLHQLVEALRSDSEFVPVYAEENLGEVPLSLDQAPSSPPALRTAFVRKYLELEIARCGQARRYQLDRNKLQRQLDLLEEERQSLLQSKDELLEVMPNRYNQQKEDRLEIVEAELTYLELKLRNMDLEARLEMNTKYGNGSQYGSGKREVFHDAIDMGCVLGPLKALNPRELADLLACLAHQVVGLQLHTWQQDATVGKLESTIAELRRTLLVMRKTALYAALEYEKRLREYEDMLVPDHARRSVSPTASNVSHPTGTATGPLTSESEQSSMWIVDSSVRDTMELSSSMCHQEDHFTSLPLSESPRSTPPLGSDTEQGTSSEVTSQYPVPHGRPLSLIPFSGPSSSPLGGRDSQVTGRRIRSIYDSIHERGFLDPPAHSARNSANTRLFRAHSLTTIPASKRFKENENNRHVISNPPARKQQDEDNQMPAGTLGESVTSASHSQVDPDSTPEHRRKTPSPSVPPSASPLLLTPKRVVTNKLSQTFGALLVTGDTFEEADTPNKGTESQSNDAEESTKDETSSDSPLVLSLPNQSGASSAYPRPRVDSVRELSLSPDGRRTNGTPQDQFSPRFPRPALGAGTPSRIPVPVTSRSPTDSLSSSPEILKVNPLDYYQMAGPFSALCPQPEYSPLFPSPPGKGRSMSYSLLPSSSGTYDDQNAPLGPGNHRSLSVRTASIAVQLNQSSKLDEYQLDDSRYQVSHFTHAVADSSKPTGRLAKSQSSSRISISGSSIPVLSSFRNRGAKLLRSVTERMGSVTRQKSKKSLVS